MFAFVEGSVDGEDVDAADGLSTYTLFPVAGISAIIGEYSDLGTMEEDVEARKKSFVEKRGERQTFS